MPTDKENILKLSNYPSFSLSHPWMRRSVEPVLGRTRVYTQLGRTGTQTATGGGTLHTSTPETSIHPHRGETFHGVSLPKGDKFLAFLCDLFCAIPGERTRFTAAGPPWPPNIDTVTTLASPTTSPWRKMKHQR